MKTIDELREELFILEQQKKLAIDLMNSSFQPVKMKTVNITEPWYDQAAKAIDEIMVPVSSLVVHITEKHKFNKLKTFAKSFENKAIEQL